MEAADVKVICASMISDALKRRTDVGLRDAIAMSMLSEIINAECQNISRVGNHSIVMKNIAAAAYAWADEMMAARGNHG